MLLTKINDLRSEKIVKKIIFLMAIVEKIEMYAAFIAYQSTPSNRNKVPKNILSKLSCNF